jgi:hypothetical protein
MQCIKCLELEHEKTSFFCHNCGKKLELFEINKSFGYDIQTYDELYDKLKDLTDLLYYPHELKLIKKEITNLSNDYLVVSLEIFHLEKPEIFLDKNAEHLEHILRSRFNIKDNVVHCVVRFDIRNGGFKLDSYTFNRILTINYFETFFFPQDAFKIITFKKYKILKSILPKYKDSYLELPLDLNKTYFAQLHRNFSSLGFDIVKDISEYEQIFTNKSNKDIITGIIKLFDLNKKHKIPKDFL